jgi:hypothetical protein
MEIIVGKQGNQKVTITDARVSRKHCKLTEQPDGSFILEDLGSSNGTFVNGNRIFRTRVTRDTILQLGPELKVKVSDLVGTTVISPLTIPPINPPQPTEVDYSAAFNRLQAVYERYSKDKVALLKDERKKNQLKSLPMFIVGIVSMLLFIIPALAPFRIYIVIIATAFAGWGAKVAFGTSVEFPEKMEALTRQFKIDYVCPKCGNFLGDIPFENLRNRKICSFCKCKWVK